MTHCQTHLQTGVNTIPIDEQDYKIWYYFVGDRKFLALVNGIDSATSQYGVNAQWLKEMLGGSSKNLLYKDWKLCRQSWLQ